MVSILNITNGDSAVQIMKEANIPGEFLPWRDVLYEGPVPSGLSLGELSDVRSRYICGQGWGSLMKVQKGFASRDATIQSSSEYEKIVLWFEHDLYDQLQLLQILDWYAENPQGDTKVSLICRDQYLGTLSAAEMIALQQYEETITTAQLHLAKRAWAAYRSSTPTCWSNLLGEDLTALPFLAGAVLRMLEEYPSCTTGLGRTAMEALNILTKGPYSFGKLFGTYQQTEERMFMGDWSFISILNQLLAIHPAVIALSHGSKLLLKQGAEQKISITAAGKEVLEGTRYLSESAATNRWIGGVQLRTEMWCWDQTAKNISRSGNVS